MRKLLSIAALAMAIAGCETIDPDQDLVVINYTLWARCSAITPISNSQSEAFVPDRGGIYLIYKIDRITNTASRARVFTFEPEYLRVRGGNEEYNWAVTLNPSRRGREVRVVPACVNDEQPGWLVMEYSRDDSTIAQLLESAPFVEQSLVYRRAADGQRVLIASSGSSPGLVFGRQPCNQFDDLPLDEQRLY